MPASAWFAQDAGVAVGLELRPDRAALCALLAGALPEDPEQVLDVMAVLVGDHVALGE